MERKKERKEGRQWVLTGISKLTGEREAFSSPHTKEVAERLLEKALMTSDEDRAFLSPMVEEKGGQS